MFSNAAALLVSLLPLLSQAAPAKGGNGKPTKAAANPIVTIASGVVIGTATGVSNQPDVTGKANAYLGVPFAAPPVRFAPPEEPQAWSTPLKAQTLPPACLQQFFSGSIGEREQAYFNNPGFAIPAESEDCLYLNIFAPQDASPTNTKSVLFWLFGGNLQFGTASLEYYNGSSLAVNHDVVVVAINYRTNMFGFSNSPEIPFGKQNSGFLDQRMALQWVQDNIKQFGGDPTKVTIFGESAGGYSVKQLLANPPDPLPFRAAIMESQQAAVTPTGAADYQSVVANFGCTTAPSQLECLRKVDGRAIQSYIVQQSLGFYPVDGDGTSSGKNTDVEILSGTFASVPIMAGTNKNEFTVFTDFLGVNRNATLVTQTVQQGTGINLAPYAAQIDATYAGKVTGSAIDVANQAVTDALFTCTTQSLTSLIAAQNRQPVWRYQFDAVIPNLQLFPNAGAYHTSEIPLVWGTYPGDNQYGQVTTQEVQLSMAMQKIWTDFAKDPYTGPGWPKLGSNGGNELGALGSTNNPDGEATLPLLSADYPCVLFDPILIAGGQAY